MVGIPKVKYISPNRGGFEVQKSVNGKPKHLAQGKTLIIALMKLDWCKAHDWSKYPSKFKHIYKIKDGYAIYKFNGAKNEYFGYYKCLSDAEMEVELLERVGWDLDAWCDLH